MKVKIGPHRKNRAYHIHIDNYDTWNIDYTLATIIHPLLCKFRDTHHSYPDVDRYEDECYHEWDQQGSFEEILDRDAESKYYEELWNTRINKMCRAFGLIIHKDDHERAAYESDEGYSSYMDEYYNTIDEGLHLFVKWYGHLWD